MNAENQDMSEFLKRSKNKDWRKEMEDYGTQMEEWENELKGIHQKEMEELDKRICRARNKQYLLFFTAILCEVFAVNSALNDNYSWILFAAGASVCSYILMKDWVNGPAKIKEILESSRK